MLTTTTTNSEADNCTIEQDKQVLYSLFLEFLRTIAKTGKVSLLGDVSSSYPGKPVPRRPVCVESETFGCVLRDSLATRRHRRPSTLSDLRSYSSRILRFSAWGERDIRSISRSDCRELLNRYFGRSAHIFSKARIILHSIFAYGVRQGYCEYNPVDGIDPRPIHEDPVYVLALKDIRALLKATEEQELQNMDAAVRLMLWCGIRPGEVQRLRWRDIDRRENCVYIDGRASKTGGARAVPLRGGARKLRTVHRPPNEYIAPRNWMRQWANLRRRAGLRQWQRDAMRHSFASYHLKYFHNLYLLQEEMGHRDSTLLRTRYLNLRNLSSVSAQTFFKME